MARRARALKTLLEQVNARYPLRDTGSDGWIGDQAHADRPSDHNPDEHGVVQAQDFDEDTGALGRWLWDALLASRDRRVSYVIYEGRMFSSYPARGYPAWAVRPYSGSNKHLQHLHISVSDDPALYDDATPWDLPGDEEDDMPTPEEIAKAVWDHKIGSGDQSKPAWSRLHDADVRTREIKEAVAKLAVGAAAKAAEIAAAVVGRLADKLGA